MTEPLVVDYLKTHTLDDLEREHGVLARRTVLGDKISLNYDMLRLVPGDLLAEQCRGIVLAGDGFATGGTCTQGDWKKNAPELHNWRLLAWPMNRFYNLTEPCAAPVAFGAEGTRVWEKVDGTLIILYWDPKPAIPSGYASEGKWQVATRAVPEADVVGEGGMTFRGLFFRAAPGVCAAHRAEAEISVQSTFEALFQHQLDRGVTYCFELCTPDNRVVVKHTEDKLYLLAARRIATGEELDPTTLSLPVPLPHRWGLSTPEEIQAYVHEAGGITLEGAVVCDAQFRRVKIKSAAWAAFSGVRDAVGRSRRARLEAILRDDLDDTLALLDEVAPDDAAALRTMQTALHAYVAAVDARFALWKDEATDRKHFAAIVTTSTEWSAIYFALYAGHDASAMGWILGRFRKGMLGDNALEALAEQAFGKEIV